MLQSSCRKCRLEALESRALLAVTPEPLMPFRDLDVLAQPVESGGVLFFAMDDGTHGMELWSSDGTAGGTRLVKDLRPGPEGSSPKSLTTLNGRVYFLSGDSLWTTDGTDEGTLRVGGPPSNALTLGQLTRAGNQLFFVALTGSPPFYRDARMSLWVSDGTNAGTRRIGDLGSYIPPMDLPRLWPLGESVLFSAWSPTEMELWKSDGTEAGTSVVVDPTPGKATSVLRIFGTAGDLGYFSLYDGERFQLWRTDGTEAGTYDLLDAAPESNDGTLYRSVDLDGALFFTADDGVHGRELWRSGGLPTNTGMIADLWPGSQSSAPGWIAQSGDDVYFVAGDAKHGWELWRSDGTVGGTNLVRDVWPGPKSGPEYAWLTDVNETVFFVASDGVHSQALWKSNGTAEATELVADLWPGSTSGHTEWLVNLQGTLLFVTRDDAGSRKLWSLRPTPGDTNYDGVVTMEDFARVKNSFGRVKDGLAADLDHNGRVDLSDFGILKAHFGQDEARATVLDAARADVQPALLEIDGDLLLAVTFQQAASQRDAEKLDVELSGGRVTSG